VTLLLVQVAASLATILVLGAYATTKHAKHPAPESELQMVIYVVFVERNYAEFLGPMEGDGDIFTKSPAGTPKTHAGTPRSRVSQFLALRKMFDEKGYVSIDDVGGDRSRWTGITVAPFLAALLIVIAPFYCYVRSYEWEEDRTTRAFPIIHSDERGVNLLQNVFVFAVLGLEMVVAAYFLDGWLRVAVIAYLALGALFVLYKVARILSWQARWKEYWSDLLLQGLSKATKDNDHDLYNRTFSLYQTVRSEPNLPLSNVQRLAVLAFGLAQVVVTQAHVFS
jgi:hypothetical protein